MRWCRSAGDHGDPQEHTGGRSGSDVRVSNEPYAGHRQKLTKTSAALRDGGMIFGNPYEFAILVEVIPKWSDDTYKNGMFHFFIDGKMFPDEVVASTLDVDLSQLLNWNSLASLPENYEIFHLDKAKAFDVMWRLAYPDLDEDSESAADVRSSLVYKASTTNIDDCGMKVFCVRWNNECRIVGARTAKSVKGDDDKYFWVDFSEIEVFETFVGISYVEEILGKVREFAELNLGFRKTGN